MSLHNEILELQQNNPASVELTLEDISVDPAVPINLTGKTVFVSVKRRTDYKIDDTEALITSKITVHTTPLSGITTWTLTAAQTLIPLGHYKADVRIYTGATDYGNSFTFYVDIVPIVTTRLI